MRPIVEKLNTAFDDVDVQSNCSSKERELTQISMILFVFASGDENAGAEWRRGYDATFDDIKNRWEELGGDTYTVSAGCGSAVQRIIKKYHLDSL